MRIAVDYCLYTQTVLRVISLKFRKDPAIPASAIPAFRRQPPGVPDGGAPEPRDGNRVCRMPGQQAMGRQMGKHARRGRPLGATGLLAALLPVLVAAAAGGAQDAPGAGTESDGQTSRLPERGGSTARAPIRVFTDERGRSCRVYARPVVIDGEARTAYATVCREPNGRWVLSR